jgi:hypothetical protein
MGVVAARSFPYDARCDQHFKIVCVEVDRHCQELKFLRLVGSHNAAQHLLPVEQFRVCLITDILTDHNLSLFDPRSEFRVTQPQSESAPIKRLI